MAKCPRCEARKGKRHCIALDTEICARCCARERLETISCPETCPHLQGEHYQHTRRRSRAESSGRRLQRDLEQLFPREDRRGLALYLLADTYWWTRGHGRLPGGQITSAYEEVASRQSSILVSAARPEPLAAFLVALLERSPRYTSGPIGELATETRQRTIAALVRYVETLGPPDGFTFQEVLDGYFGHLDFVVDLQYSPDEELEAASPEAPPAPEPRRSPGGLYLPGS